MSYHLSIFFLKAHAGFVSPRSSNFFFFVSLSYGGPRFFPYFFHSHLGFFHPDSFSFLGPAPTPLPAGSPHPALLKLPCQPVSFSPMLRANRVEQPGWGRPRGRKTLKQSERIVGTPSRTLRHFRWALTSSVGDNAGCRGRRLPTPFWWSRPPPGKTSRCKPLLPQIESKDNDNIHYHTRSGFLRKLN